MKNIAIQLTAYISLMVIGTLFSMVVFAAESDQLAQNDADQQAVHARSLAASCAACHGTQGNPVVLDMSTSSIKVFQLAGINSQMFIKKMDAFKTGERAATVMHHHAKGLSSEEITNLANYFSKQKPQQVKALSSQPYIKLPLD